MSDYDVLIIGAGAAGLSAARHLSEHGLTLAILEARDRIGGRIYTVRPPGANLPVEMGAEFIHGRAPITFDIVRAAGLTPYELEGGDYWHSSPDGLRRDGADEDEEDADDTADADTDGATVEQLGPDTDAEDSYDGGRGLILKAIRAWPGEDMPLRVYLDRNFPGDRWAEARASVLGYISGFDAADPERVSIRWVALTERASDTPDGERQFHLVDGYDRVLEWLRAGLSPERTVLRLNTVVREVRWSSGQVEVAMTSPTGDPMGALTARAAIVTLPLGVLLAAPDTEGAVRFTPDPPQMRAALGGMAMGHALHTVLRFRDQFWDGGSRATFQPQMPHLLFLFSSDPTISTWWTRYPLLAPMLTGWVGGPRAERLSALSDEAIVGEALGSLARALHTSRSALEAGLVDWHLHNWSLDPYSRGAYSYVLAGGYDSPGRLAAPIDGTLFFAGEATDTTGNTGTVHAALASGRRAAEQVIMHLRRS